MLFSILVVLAFAWIFIRVVMLLLRAAWSVTKLVALLLLVPAIPVLIGCFLLAGGAFLLIPLVMLSAAWLILRYCL